MFLNTCLDCKTISEKGYWKVTYKKGPIFKTEMYEVGPEPGPDPVHFDLDVINVKELAVKFNCSEDEADEAIMNGEPICINCKSAAYFEYDEKIDGEIKMKEGVK